MVDESGPPVDDAEPIVELESPPGLEVKGDVTSEEGLKEPPVGKLDDADDADTAGGLPVG